MPDKKKSGRSDMYYFIDRRWNPVRGACGYRCTYCYVNRWGNTPKPIHLDEKVLREDLGSGDFIFVCSGCDLFHPDVPNEWIERVIAHTKKYPENRYLWHTKNTERALEFQDLLGEQDTLCITIESDYIRPNISSAPPPNMRSTYLDMIKIKYMITIEPIMNFSLELFAEMITDNEPGCHPVQVNIGADSGGNNLPEPPREKIERLIELIAPYTTVHLKPNLRRILPEHRLYAEPSKRLDKLGE
jgi:DNA repair photolyase